MSPEELAESLHSGGYQGCVITNHFFHGNTGIDRNLPWDAFVAEYEKDYLKCKKAAQKYDLDIIFGLEEHLFGGLEILCYGITPQFLYDNPCLANSEPKIWYDALHSFGALCIQAHPYRERGYITNPGPLPIEFIDGVEVYNYSNKFEENDIAEEFVSQHPNFVLTSGADAHSGNLMCKAGIETNVRITDEKILAHVLKLKKYQLIK